MTKLTQNRAPIHEALEEFKRARVVPFDVPGHKRGRGNPELAEFLGERCLTVDVNSMKPLDNLCHPVSVIREAEELAAEAFGASAAFFIVNGTTSAVQAMILSACKKGDKIILPRNVHRSAINALVLCGAVPVYINPRTHPRLGISLGMTVSDVRAAMDANPDAVAVFVNNPTYYGVCSDIVSIVRLAHERGMLVLADEAHGTHFYFGDNLPVSAMAAGADMASVSMHKSGGSLTQSSFLLCGGMVSGEDCDTGGSVCGGKFNDYSTGYGRDCNNYKIKKRNVNPGYVRQILNLTQTTSASYLLLSSLDISRRNLSLRGRNIFARVMELADYARGEINQIGDYYAYSDELCGCGRDGEAAAADSAFFAFDKTKLSINTFGVGLAGIEVYDILRDEYDIQVEFGDLGNILAYISIGDSISRKNIERFIGALSEIRRKYKNRGIVDGALMRHEYIPPKVVLSPQKAFYSSWETLPIEQSAGRISSEFVMCYPPGIPILAPGEEITAGVIEYIEYAKAKGCSLTGTEDMEISRIRVVRF